MYICACCKFLLPFYGQYYKNVILFLNWSTSHKLNKTTYMFCFSSVSTFLCRCWFSCVQIFTLCSSPSTYPCFRLRLSLADIYTYQRNRCKKFWKRLEQNINLFIMFPKHIRYLMTDNPGTVYLPDRNFPNSEALRLNLQNYQQVTINMSLHIFSDDHAHIAFPLICSSPNL